MTEGKPTKPGKPETKNKGNAEKSDRGKFRFQKGSDGHADFVEVCIREGDGSYVWHRVMTS